VGRALAGDVSMERIPLKTNYESSMKLIHSLSSGVSSLLFITFLKLINITTTQQNLFGHLFEVNLTFLPFSLDKRLYSMTSNNQLNRFLTYLNTDITTSYTSLLEIR
jgi:hypothetical protein